mgnify:CR=1 FL=1
MTDTGHREVFREEFEDCVLLPEEPEEFVTAGIIFGNDAVGLVLRQLFVAVDGTTFEGNIDPVGFELVDERLELPEEIVNDSVLAGGESAASTVSRIHEVDAEDGHEIIVS